MWLFLLIALVAVIGFALYNRTDRNKKGRGEAKIGPDGTNVNPPETFVVHHEGKGQGLDVANTALKERTEQPQRDLPGREHEVRNAPIPGRQAVTMDRPPSDVSAYGDEKVAPGQAGSGRGKVVEGDPNEPGETKEQVLSEGPVGSRPGTPEEPGSPYAKGRRVTDIQRSIEAGAELLPDLNAHGRRGEPGERNTRSPGEVGLGDTMGEGSEEEGIAFVPDPETGDARFHFEAAREWLERDWSHLHAEDSPPPAAGMNDIIALVKDPHSLYVYWGELLTEPPDTANVRGTQKVLRLYDAAGTERLLREHTLEQGVDHWWINDLPDGRTYYGEIGLVSPEGIYTVLGRSAMVETPHASPAPAARHAFWHDPGGATAPGTSPGARRQ